MRQSDEGVAPILAILLLLGLVVAFMGAWNSTVIPTMKEEAELIHTTEVENAFVRFSADVQELSRKMQSGTTASVTIPLGGGETLFDASRSAGTIRILPNDSSVQPQLMRISVKDVVVPLPNVTLASVVYHPQNNFWQNQGYCFAYGYVNVTRGSTLSVPLQYGDMRMLAGDPDMRDRVHAFLTVTQDAIRTVSWKVDEKNILASGNGRAVLSVSSRVLRTAIPAGKEITINVAPSGTRPDWLINMVTTLLEEDLNASAPGWTKTGNTYTFTLTKDAVLEQAELLFSVR